MIAKLMPFINLFSLMFGIVAALLYIHERWSHIRDKRKGAVLYSTSEEVFFESLAIGLEDPMSTGFESVATDLREITRIARMYGWAGTYSDARAILGRHTAMLGKFPNEEIMVASLEKVVDAQIAQKGEADL